MAVFLCWKKDSSKLAPLCLTDLGCTCICFTRKKHWSEQWRDTKVTGHAEKQRMLLTCMAEPFRDVTGSSLVSQDVAFAQIKMKPSSIGPFSLLFLPQEGGGGLEKPYSEH